MEQVNFGALYLMTVRTILTAHSQHRPEVVEASLDACLAELELDYLDVCVFVLQCERMATDRLSFTLSTGLSLSRRASRTSLLSPTALLRAVM